MRRSARAAVAGHASFNGVPPTPWRIPDGSDKDKQPGAEFVKLEAICMYIVYGNAKSIPGVCSRREPQFVIAYASKIIFDAKHQVCMRQESRCCHGNCPGCPEANTGVSLAGSLAGCHRQPGTTMPPGGPACNLSVVGVATRLSPASRCAAVPVVDRELVMAKRPAASAFRMAECFHSVVMGCPPG